MPDCMDEWMEAQYLNNCKSKSNWSKYFADICTLTNDIFENRFVF